MKKYSFILFVFLTVFEEVKTQQPKNPDFDGACTFFLENVLPTHIRKGGKMIVAPMSETELIGTISHGSTQFLKNLSAYYNTNDTAVLYKIARNAPKFQLPENYQSALLVFMQDTVRGYLEFTTMLQRNDWPAYAQVGNFIFSPDKKSCILFLHTYQGNGISIELVKTKENVWSLKEEKYEWIELNDVGATLNPNRLLYRFELSSYFKFLK